MHPATIAAMHIVGADKIFGLGGTRVIAAMAIGTKTIKRCQPRNAFVVEPKQVLSGSVEIAFSLARPRGFLLCTNS